MPNLKLPYVPASDASGEVAAVGEDVTRFKVGDRVVPIYTQGWHAGMPTLELRTQRTLGGPLPGVLQEYIAVPAEDAVAPPAHLSHEEAATLPIAAVTAWSTLIEGGIKAGDTVLVEGTGGVALFALQFAKLNGATVIALSSSDDKLARARELGADIGINYRTTPEWNVGIDAAQGAGLGCVRRLRRRGRIRGRLRGHDPAARDDRPDGARAGHRRRLARTLRGDEPRHLQAQAAPGHRRDIPAGEDRRGVPPHGARRAFRQDRDRAVSAASHVL
jgi:hypothetical protein